MSHNFYVINILESSFCCFSHITCIFISTFHVEYACALFHYFSILTNFKCHCLNDVNGVFVQHTPVVQAC